MRSTAVIVALVSIAPFTGLSWHAWADEADARKLLAAKGLAPVGKTWVLREELDVRDHVDALENLEKRHLQALRQFDGAIEQNESARMRYLAGEQFHSKLVESAKSASGAQRRQMEEAAKKSAEANEVLKRQTVEAKRFAEIPPAKPAAIEYLNARNELALDLLWLRRHAESLPAQIRLLADDQAVTKALTELAAKPLSPAKANYLDAKRLAALEAQVFNERLPVYRESGFYRCSALVNEAIPVTFSFRESSDPLILPASLAQSLGLSASTDADGAVPFQTTDKRKLTVGKTKVARLRLGRFVWSDVEAYILPPEAEDLGAQLSTQSLSGHRATVDGQLLRLVIEPLK